MDVPLFENRKMHVNPAFRRVVDDALACDRCLPGNLILTYRIVNEKVGRDLSRLITPTRLSGTCGHPMKLSKPLADRISAEMSVMG